MSAVVDVLGPPCADHPSLVRLPLPPAGAHSRRAALEPRCPSRSAPSSGVESAPVTRERNAAGADPGCSVHAIRSCGRPVQRLQAGGKRVLGSCRRRCVAAPRSSRASAGGATRAGARRKRGEDGWERATACGLRPTAGRFAPDPARPGPPTRGSCECVPMCSTPHGRSRATAPFAHSVRLRGDRETLAPRRSRGHLGDCTGAHVQHGATAVRVSQVTKPEAWGTGRLPGATHVARPETRRARRMSARAIVVVPRGRARRRGHSPTARRVVAGTSSSYPACARAPR